jgi:HEAT repeat protein
VTQRTIDKLIRILRADDLEAQIAASEQLAQMGAAAVVPMIDLMREYETVEDLYKVLNNSHHWAEMTLIKIGEPAVEPLIHAVNEDYFGARVGAIFCLGELREIRAVQPLIEALWREDDETTFFDVGDALEKIGDTAVRPLIRALESSNAVIRSNAAAILGHFKDPLATPALIGILQDESQDARISAVSALGRLEDARAVEPLIAALADDDPAVREATVRVLAQIGSKLNSPRIIEVLAKAMHDSDWGTRQSAAEMLLKLDSPYANSARMLLLHDLQNEDAEIRLGAAWSLVPVKEKQAVAALLGLLDHSDMRIVSSAAQVLGDYGDKRAIPALKALLSYNDSHIKAVAQTALRKLGHDPGTDDKLV